MKKLTITAAALLFGGAAFAQNSSTSTITGSNNMTDVLQSGSGNSSEITVSGQNNGNTNGGAVGEDNMSVSQTGGDNNTAKITIGSSAHDADFNDADITQNGSGNNATIDIDYFGDGSVKADDNDANINQQGNNNKASINPLKGARNEVTINQTTDANWHIVQTQGSDNSVNIDAGGDRNNRGAWKVRQGSNFNSIDVMQTGRDNTASGDIQRGDYNEINVDQLGDDNHINSDINNWQTPGATIVDGDYNLMNITQEGDENILLINQTGDWHQANLMFTGDGNDFEAYQTGNMGGLASDGNTINLNVDGDFNSGILSQTGSQNLINADIMGNSNMMNITQSGMGNTATQTVNGHNNTINVTQN